MNYIAIYSKDVCYVNDDDRIINKEFNTIDECIDWLKQKSKKDSINFYWPQYYDKQLQKYYCAAWWTEDFMKSL